MLHFGVFSALLALGKSHSIVQAAEPIFSADEILIGSVWLAQRRYRVHFPFLGCLIRRVRGN